MEWHKWRPFNGGMPRCHEKRKWFPRTNTRYTTGRKRTIEREFTVSFRHRAGFWNMDENWVLMRFFFFALDRTTQMDESQSTSQPSWILDPPNSETPRKSRCSYTTTIIDYQISVWSGLFFCGRHSPRYSTCPDNADGVYRTSTIYMCSSEHNLVLVCGYDLSLVCLLYLS